MKMETFHELYRLVKINYNMHPEENVQSEVIEIKTEEEKFKGEAKFINMIEKRLNYLYNLRNKKLQVNSSKSKTG